MKATFSTPANGISTVARSIPSPASTPTDPTATPDLKDTSVNTLDIPSLDLIAREAELTEREPLAPDSPRPPGSDGLVDLDESLAARAPIARCADGNGTLTGLFFSDNVVDIARAKAMCALCPLRFECLEGALEREEPWGVWGGELLSGGRIVANKRPCGRPPKHPRPEVVYDEMGPVGVVA
ncbi:WhiB family transcriptional regulator [Ilumatobacter nonamiensis]|uniref:WhiB family transcriptional regulator n=1 Tax=Ilumatobacter nonamiensis TaxID=467093 RepID=UPI000A03D8B0|nr:WhiB family transcriptional regulator [Ilumatobacter nonamiensis]